MCCSSIIIKFLEWTGMFHLVVYSSLTLTYVALNTLIAIGLTYPYHETLDILISIYCIFVSCFLYIQALACLTTNDRMCSMMDKITSLVPLPAYQRVRALRKDHRVYLLFG